MIEQLKRFQLSDDDMIALGQAAEHPEALAAEWARIATQMDFIEGTQGGQFGCSFLALKRVRRLVTSDGKRVDTGRDDGECVPLLVDGGGCDSGSSDSTSSDSGSCD